MNEDKTDFWYARDLAPLLDYPYWRDFVQVVDKAKVACERSSHLIRDHFDEVNKMVGVGSGAKRAITDYKLSRYACYLIVQNGDPSKPVIANGQTYFALQTRRQELQDNELAANLFRATQTEEKLRRDAVSGKRQANQTHFDVGTKVRQTIRELGGTMPESLPTPEVSVQQPGRQRNKLNG